MTQTFDVAVIGLGAMGSAALQALAGRGHRVVGIERFEPGHDKGSSHGESRAIRLAYSEHPSYVPLLHSAYAKWRALEAETGEELLTITGILEAGYPGCDFVKGSIESSRIHGLAHELLDAAEIGRRFPAFKLPDGWSGLFQPDGGFLRPERAIAAFVEQAKRAGAEVRNRTRVLSVKPGPGSISVHTDRGTIEGGTRGDHGGPLDGRFRSCFETRPETHAPGARLVRARRPRAGAAGSVSRLRDRDRG